MKILKANKSHFESIISIYNWAIEKTTATFDTELKTLINYSEFLNSFTILPLLVSVDDSNNVTGWGCLKRYSDRSAYDETVELSIYIDPKHHGNGIGKEMMNELLLKAQDLKLHVIISRITQDSKASIKLHEKFGFEHVGVMREVGLKFDKRINVILMQKIL
jgi:L-amino acid N-acyltransferase YncA